MREDCKENSPMNARRSVSSEKEIKKHRNSLSSDEEVFYQSKCSLSPEEEIKTKQNCKEDTLDDTLPLSDQNSITEKVAPRRPRKKIRPLRERVVDLTAELSDDSADDSILKNLPSPLSVSKKPLPVVKPKSPEPSSCEYCGLTEDQVTECSASLDGAKKEKYLLKLPEIRSSWKISDELPCVKLVNFRVYDKARHLCPYDGKLIKAENGLYISGYVKPFDSEKTDLSDLVPCENVGPITDWWFEGFDPNDESSLGLTTEKAHYYLETPMAEYVPFMASVKEKIYVAKIVIDIMEDVSDDVELSYDGLLDTLKDKVPPEGIPTLTEEILVKNGIFVCEQVQSYDAAADDDEKLMASMPCIEELARKVDFDFTAKSDDDSDSDISICEGEKVERPVIDFIDLDEIESSEDDEQGPRRARRRCRKFYTDFDWLNEDDEVKTKRGRKPVKRADDNYDSDNDEESDDDSNDDDSDSDASEEENEKKSRHRKRQSQVPRRRYHQGPKKPPIRRVMMPTKTIKLSKATTTPLVENIFESFFSGEIMRNYTRDYSDAGTGLTTNRVFNSTRSHDDYNLKPLNVCLTKLEDMGIDWEKHKIRFPCEWSDEEESQVTELEQVVEPQKMESKDEHMIENEKVEAENSSVLENDDKNPKSEQENEKMETESREELVVVSDEEAEEMDTLRISLPVTRELKSVLLKPMDPEFIEAHISPKKKRKKEDIINLDSSDGESDAEPSSKRMKTSEKAENPEDDRCTVPEKAEISEDDGYTVPEFRQMLKRKKTRRSGHTKTIWIDEPYKEIDGYEYYKKVQIDDSIVSVGDFISTYSSNSIGCIKYLFENIDKEKLFHIHWFTRSMDTILAEVGHPNEVFESSNCEDLLLKEFYQVVSVQFVPTGSDWFETGNMTYVNHLNKNQDPSRFLYYQKRFCEKTARFSDAEPESSCSFIDCSNCERQRKLVQREIPYSEEKSKFDKEHKMFALKMLRWRDEEYHIGSCVFLTPGSIMKIQPKKNEVDNDDKNYDEDLYPEKYRKPNHVKSVQDEDVLSDPFEIGYICAIWSKKQEITKSADVRLTLKKFYRPHNTNLPQDEIRTLDLNLLYSSDEECTVNFSKVQGKCYVSYKKNLPCSVDEWTQMGAYRFYFTQSYDSESGEFKSPSPFAKKIGNLEKDDEKEHIEIPKDYPPISRPLRSLDVFAGCGGLTEGLHQAKVADCHWAIEKNTAAAKAFKSNYPDAAVFTDDCNLLLSAVMNREAKVWAGKELPQKGDVEMLCGGPPCQGFSGMNRFRFGQWSKFNNSLVVTFLSYCDYYRPRFFIMENVRNFVSHEKSVVLKLTLNCLVKMGYQVAFGVLQSGRYGIPQSRRRVIILAAAPGETLPLHPEATHTFALRGFETVMVDDLKYVTSTQWSTGAPYRMITVYDALSDLPPIKSGDSKLERSYGQKAVTHFQRQLRSCNGVGEEETVLRDHISKSLSALVVKRLSFIPKTLNCDWRDLPNIVVKLSDGTMTKKLEYTHHDAKQGKASNGALRGVCSCANNGKCRSEFRQSNTIIPWCLPHTSNRHGHWRGLYGRLGWDEYFRTVVTNPEPMGKQGRVVHPEEDRVISVKECARSQGFPDSFKFYGCILDKHRQIGNAVAPPLAKAIGLEIKKCIHEKESKVQVID